VIPTYRPISQHHHLLLSGLFWVITHATYLDFRLQTSTTNAIIYPTLSKRILRHATDFYDVTHHFSGPAHLKPSPKVNATTTPQLSHETQGRRKEGRVLAHKGILIRSAALLLFATSLLGLRKACVQMIPSFCFCYFPSSYDCMPRFLSCFLFYSRHLLIYRQFHAIYFKLLMYLRHSKSTLPFALRNTACSVHLLIYGIVPKN